MPYRIPTADDYDPKNWPADREVKQILEECRVAVWRGQLEEGPDWHLLAQWAGILSTKGQNPEAVLCWQEVMTWCLANLGKDDHNTLRVRSALAYSYFYSAVIELAIVLLEKNLQEHLRVLGPTSLETLTSRSSLAAAYKAIGRVLEAVDLSEENFGAHLRLHGQDARETLVSRQQLALCLEAAGRIPDAIKLQEMNLREHVRLYGPDATDTLTARRQLAAIYRASGEKSVAVVLSEDVLRHSLTMFGPDAKETMVARDEVAASYEACGRMPDAITWREANLRNRLRLLGPDSVDTLASRDKLANCYFRAGLVTEAIAIHTDSLREHQRVSGTDSYESWIRKRQLFDYLFSANRASEAIQVLEEHLAACVRKLGPDSALSLFERWNLSKMYVLCEQFDSAIRELEVLLDAIFKVGFRPIRTSGERLFVGGDRVLTINEIVQSLVHAYAALGRYCDAAEALTKALGRTALHLVNLNHTQVAERLGPQQAAALAVVQSAEETARLAYEGTLLRLQKIREERHNLQTRLKYPEQSDEAKQKIAKADAALAAEQQQFEQQRDAQYEDLKQYEERVWLRLKDVYPDVTPRPLAEVVAELADGEAVLMTPWSESTAISLLITRGAESQPQITSSVIRAATPSKPDWRLQRLARIAQVWSSTPKEGSDSSSRAASSGDGIASAIDRAFVKLALSHLIDGEVRTRLRDAKRVILVGGGLSQIVPLPTLLRLAGDELAHREFVSVPSVEIYLSRRKARDARLRHAAATANTRPRLLAICPVRFGRTPAGRSQSGSASTGSQPSKSGSRSPFDELAIDRDASDRAYLADLPCTLHEVQAVEKIIQGNGGEAVLLTEAQATRANVERHLPGTRYVILATHGRASRDPSRPMDATIYLSPGEVTGTDSAQIAAQLEQGKLTGEHILSFGGKLTGCELMIISACESGRGSDVGDGELALPVALFNAGVETLLVTRERVSDVAASLLVARFMEGITGSFGCDRTALGKTFTPGTPMPKAAALAEAQRWLSELTRAEVKQLREDAEMGVSTYHRTDRDEDGRVDPSVAADRPFQHPCFWGNWELWGAG